ncbi:MAG: DNA repair protein RadA [SAR202 cluster bacterium]|nr:DNA repair protein RadA [SAR202 cluster bacterium]
MPSNKTLFFCQNCGHESPKWMGFCAACGLREPLVEAPSAPKSAARRSWIGGVGSQPQELSQVSTKDQPRISMGMPEVDTVLGGGLVSGSLLLFAGEPGVGKSTLLLQVASHVSGQGRQVLYVSGEESERQIKLRSDRMALSGQGVFLLAETDVDLILQRLNEMKPALAIIDSIQTLSTQEIESGPGGVAQVRECALRLLRWAKASSTPVLLAGHVTKDGALAGPRVLEHMVDVVLYLDGENLGAHRVLRSVKNRFGSTNEVAILQMDGKGLKEVQDPSQALLAERGVKALGSAITPILEGTRPLMVEIQALTSPSGMPVPRRTANGVDFNRMIMVAAVLGRRTRLSTAAQDIIVNVAGGMKVTEPAADLALALALASSLKNQPIKQDLVAIGEIGLSGELRSATQMERRLSEAARLGFKQAILPATSQGKLPLPQGMTPIYVPTLARAVTLALDNSMNGAQYDGPDMEEPPQDDSP